MQITPYALSLVQYDQTGRPNDGDPMWQQFVAQWPDGAEAFDKQGIGWEHPRDMVAPNIQKKYPNRVLLRTTNSCAGYCQFCVLAVRVLDENRDTAQLEQAEWEAALTYIDQNREIEEVILSGGDPFLLDDRLLIRRLGDLRSIPRDLLIRVNTRTLTYNPFRITTDLCAALEKYRVNTIGVHITHPHEITPQFLDSVRALKRAVPIMVSNIPLLGGVNDDVDTMRTLCMSLYRSGIVGGYLFHFAPNTPGAAIFGTSITAGIKIMRGLERHISSPAIPAYVLLHPDGKLNVPIDDSLTILAEGASGAEATFRNWRGDVVSYKSGQY